MELTRIGMLQHAVDGHVSASLALKDLLPVAGRSNPPSLHDLHKKVITNEAAIYNNVAFLGNFRKGCFNFG